MKKWKRNGSFISVAILILLCISLAGCLDEGYEEEGPLELRDQTGDRLSFNETPRRVVALAPSLCEIVVELGGGNMLVGADSASVRENPDLKMETVATWEGLDTEKLVDVSPDLVLIDKNLDFSDSNHDAVSSLSIPVYRSFPQDLDEVMLLIEDIGTILGKEETATEIVDDMKYRRDDITEKAQGIEEDDRPEVLYVTYYDGSDDPYVGTTSTFSGDIIEMAGGRNCLEDDSGIIIKVSVETIIDADPDIIITSQSELWPTPTRETILSDDAWSDITAVREREVHDVDGDLIDRTGPGLVDGLETIYGILYT